jgi:hypothetical protein
MQKLSSTSLLTNNIEFSAEHFHHLYHFHSTHSSKRSLDEALSASSSWCYLILIDEILIDTLDLNKDVRKSGFAIQFEQK